ncbi:MAG TPA: nuclear transport factor 2 family protein [Candidatus Eremiobacteraceae bacterium]
MDALTKADPAATRAAVEGYFAALKAGKDWQRFISDDVVFTSRTSPNRQLSGRSTFLEATKRFYSTIAGVDVRQLIVDGDRACVLSRYVLKPPAGPSFESDVAEVFEVLDNKIAAFDIYFDSAPYPK